MGLLMNKQKGFPRELSSWWTGSDGHLWFCSTRMLVVPSRVTWRQHDAARVPTTMLGPVSLLVSGHPIPLHGSELGWGIQKPAECRSLAHNPEMGLQTAPTSCPAHFSGAGCCCHPRSDHMCSANSQRQQAISRPQGATSTSEQKGPGPLAGTAARAAGRMEVREEGTGKGK